jgi:hypothetical protein
MRRIIIASSISAAIAAAACGGGETSPPKTTPARATMAPIVPAATVVAMSPSARPGGTATVGQNVVTIGELGIQLTVDDSIRDLVYVVSTADCCPSRTTAHLSSQTLINLGSYCASDSATIGIVNRTVGQLPATGREEGEEEPPTLVRQFRDFYIAYYAPQAACSSNSGDQDIQATQIRAVKAAFNTLELSQ